MQNDEFEIVEEVNIKRRDFYLVRNAGKMGLLTSKDQVRIPVEWDELKIDSHFKNKDFVHIPPFYSLYNERNDPVVIVFGRKNKHWGVMDLYGETIIPAVYETIEMVHFADLVFFKVSVNGREGLICLNKNILVPVKWEKILPADLSTPSACPPFLWTSRANYLFCFESFNNLKNGGDQMDLREERPFQFVIYNRYFELVTPEALDGYAIITAGYRLIKPVNNLTYILIRKQDRYGVLSQDIRLINKPELTYEQAIALIRKQQQNDYIKILIDDIKVDCKKINKYLEQYKIAAKTADLPTQKMTGDGLTRESNRITKAEIKKMAAALTDQFTDLKAFKLAEWARKMEALIENENHQAFLAIIGDLLEWLQSLKVNPELTFENRPVIKNENDQELQPEYNRGFAEAILNSESEFQKEHN